MAAEAAPTAGPWRVVDTRDRTFLRIKGAVSVVTDAEPATRCSGGLEGYYGGGALICEGFEGHDSRTSEQALANARLVAAAPDLLAASEDALGALEALLGSDGEDPTQGAGDQSAVAKLRAAIAKAKGGR